MASRGASILGRILLVVFGLVLLAFAFLYTRMPKPLSDRVEAALDVTGVNSGGAFAWIIKTPKGAALVDSGLDPKATAILDELKKEGLGADDVHFVLVTHGHPDHYGGAGVFAKAKVYVGAADVPFVRGEAEPKSTLLPLMKKLAAPPARPDAGAIVALKGDETLDLDGLPVKVIAVPGHTPGSVMYLLPSGLLFTGDSLLGRNGGEKVGLAPSALSADAGENERSLKRLLALPFTEIADGHTGVTADARQKLARFVE